MPWVFKKLQGSRIESLAIHTFKIVGTNDDDDVTDQYLPALIQNITPEAPEDAVCTNISFETDEIKEPIGSTEKLSDFIEAHIPDGEAKCPIRNLYITLNKSDNEKATVALEFVSKIFSRPGKWDVTDITINGFDLSQTGKNFIPDWLQSQRNLRSFGMNDCCMNAERLGLILNILADIVINYDREYYFNFKQNMPYLAKQEGVSYDAQEILCEFLGKLPPERKINLTCDPQILKSWTRDSNDPAKVTLEYLEPT